jgi:predicted DNA-binding mobile mystery protein A
MAMTLNSRSARTARRVLDQRFHGFPAREELAPPPLGWIRALRDALGMSAADLAARVGAQAATVRDLERSEQAGSIQLRSLQRTADAMNCDLVYALVPRQPLATIVEEQAMRQLAGHLQAVGRSMDLENQGTTIDDEAVQDAITAQITSGRLWK